MRNEIKLFGAIAFAMVAAAIVIAACDTPVEAGDPPTERVFGIGLSVTGVHNFPARSEGYEADGAAPLEVAVTNMGDRPTGALTVSLVGDVPWAFALSAGVIPSIAPGETARFTVRPALGLSEDVYEATVKVSNLTVTAQSFDVTFVVNDLVNLPTPKIESTADGVARWAFTEDAERVSTFRVFVNGDPVSAGISACATEFDLAGSAKTELAPGEIHQVTLKALGVAGVSNDSPKSAPRDFAVQLPPPAITVMGRIVSWAAWDRNLPAYGFRVYADGVAIPGGQTCAGTKSFNLAEAGFALGVHRISARALGLHDGAHDSRLSSAQSAEWEFVRALPPALIALDQNAGRISWGAIPEANGGFAIYVNGIRAHTVGAGAMSFVLRAPREGDQIRVRALRAGNAGLNSDLSNMVIFGADFDLEPLGIGGQVWMVDFENFRFDDKFEPGAEVAVFGHENAWTISAGGWLNFAIAMPSYLENFADYFDGFTVEPADTRAARVWLWTGAPAGWLNGIGGFAVSGSAVEYWLVEHIFVDRDVSIFGGDLPVPINLARGWNALYYQFRWDPGTQEGRRIIALSVDSPIGADIRWIWSESVSGSHSHPCPCVYNGCECGANGWCKGDDCECIGGEPRVCGCGNV